MRHLDEVHPTATLGDGVTLGSGVRIGPGAVVYDNVTLGDGCVIGAQVVLGEPLAAHYTDLAYVNPPLVLGADCIVRSGTVIYAGSTIGERFETGHHVTIREHMTIGRNCRIGTLSDFQGHSRLGHYVRIHSNVLSSQGVVIGDFAWVFPYTVLADCPHPPSNETDPVTIEPFAVISARCLVLPGVRIGRDALVGAASLVTKDVAPETFVRGHPAREIGSVRELLSKRTGRSMYPWRDHFDRGMPWEGIGYDAWRARGGT